MPDSLILRDLELRLHIGVTEEERKEQQRVLLTVEMAVDTRAAAKADDMASSIDYAMVAGELKTLEKTERKTVERLAEEAAELVLKRFGASSVTVTVMKFPAIGVRQIELKITRP